MEGKKRIIIAIVVVLTAIIVAIAARQIIKKRKKRDKYQVGNPAAPRQEEAAQDLGIHFQSIVNLGTSFQAKVNSMGAQEKALLPTEGTLVTIVKSMTKLFDNAQNSLAQERPTYERLLSFYHGIIGSDKNFLNTASSLVDAGNTTHQNLDLAKEGLPVASYEAVGEAGQILIEFGREIRGLIMSVHRLGVTLDVE
jgi:hypothetical protein